MLMGFKFMWMIDVNYWFEKRGGKWSVVLICMPGEKVTSVDWLHRSEGMDPPPSQDHLLFQLSVSPFLSPARGKLVHSLNSSHIPPLDLPFIPLSLHFNITSSFANGSLSGCLSPSLSLPLLSWGVSLSLSSLPSPLWLPPPSLFPSML